MAAAETLATRLAWTNGLLREVWATLDEYGEQGLCARIHHTHQANYQDLERVRAQGECARCGERCDYC